MDTTTLLQEALNLPRTELPHLKALRAIVHSDVPHDLNFQAQQSLLSIIQEYNDLVKVQGLGESCVVKPTDSTKTIRKRCKKAFRHGLKHYPMRYIYAVSGSPMASGLGEEYNPYDSPDTSIKTFTGQLGKDTRKIKKPLTLKLVDPESGLHRDDDTFEMVEGETSTERVRKYYKRHPEKVRKYLRDTVKDRVARNRDRRKAVKKHGNTKMKNHDVHHPNGAQNGNWKLAKKDHGRDKKNVNEVKNIPQTNTSKKPSLQKSIGMFVAFASKELKLSELPKIKIIQPTEDMTGLGRYTPNTKEIRVVVKGRLLADILRTIAHEMVHQLQHETGMELDGTTGSGIENSANAMAGILLRNYGEINKKIFLSENIIVCRFCGWKWQERDGGTHKYMCHKCWNNNTQYLTEGGAAGHLAHPFEDPDLTFADMKEMIDRGLTGGLDAEAPVTEKLDGQNISFSVRDGQVVFARNKGHVKNRGQNALDVAGIRQMFAGRGNIERAFTQSAEDLQAALDRLTPEQREEMFGNGSKFMSAEIIFPDTENVIPYGKSVLVMHGTMEYDENGEEIGRQPEAGKILSDAITAVGAQRQRTFGIEGPRTIAFDENEAERYQQRAEEYKSALDRAAASLGLSDDDTLADYRRKWWDARLTQISQEQGIEFTKEERAGLIKRWADYDKSFGVKNIEDPEKKKWFRQFESEQLQSEQKKMIRPIETTFLRAGADAILRTTNTLGANNPEAAEKLKKSVLDAIEAIKQSDDPDKIAKLQREMERLQSIGIDRVVPSEGVVFIYNGKPYKFTGTFAPINQILGTFKFGMAPKEPPKEEPTKEEPKDQQPPTEEKPETPEQPEQPKPPRRTVAIFTGRFQPFHAGHYSVYQSLVEKFGKENVYIASSNVTDAVKSPFDFNERKEIITRMFGVPEDMVVQVKNPYAPTEILDKLPEDTVYVTAVSQKDADRLGGKYFHSLEDTPEEERKGYKDGGYVMIAPEMQLDLNGKNISGTALRAAMGDPKITERAKKEIFTKVYGKFDQDIFDKIVKVTTKSEEARALTAQYGEEKPKGKRKKAEEPTEPSSETPSTEEPSDDIEAARSVLKQKIKNPLTGREILVATALKYEPDEPVRKAAEQLIQQAIANARKKREQPTQEIITEAVNPDKLKVYLHVREFTDEELAEEVEEYFDNEKTFRAFPDLADDREQLIKMIEDADEEVLTTDELLELTNSDVGDILTSDNPKQLLIKVATDNQKDLPRLKKALAGKQDLPMPIVIKHSEGYYLMAGNTRLSLLAAKGYTIPVKVLIYDKPAHLAPVTAPLQKSGARQNKAKEMFKKLLKMRVRNPETNNYIKIDTAMDYNKQHPAHKLAMNTIRQHMRGLSNRAGVPKNRRD